MMGGVRDSDRSVGWVGISGFRLEGRGWEMLVLVNAVDACVKLGHGLATDSSVYYRGAHSISLSIMAQAVS